MWRFPVTIEAPAVFQEIMVIRLYGVDEFLLYCFFMASDTILPDQIPGFIFHDNHLWFEAKGKHGSVVEPIFGFKKKFVEDVVMRYMTVIASGYPAVGIMYPVGIVGNHHMTIDAGLGIVAQVGLGF